MKKLFVINNSDNLYLNEVELAFQLFENLSCIADESIIDFNLDQFSNIDIIICNSPSKIFLEKINRIGIVSIVFGDQRDYFHLADITIDYLSSNPRLFFSGINFSLSNRSFNFIEVANLISTLNWDTDFFGFPIAYLSCRHLTINIQNKVDKYVLENEIKLVEYLCDCHDDLSVKVAENNKYHFTDIRLTFSKLLNNSSIEMRDSIDFEIATLSDLKQLKNLTENLYKDSRYYYDGNFDLNQINVFYSEWLEKAILGTFDNECFCLKIDNIPIAFCTIRYLIDNTASIGLFGVSPGHSGKGYGKQLINNVLNKCYADGIKKIYVVTQGRNYAAQRLYQSVGFRTESTELWYHNWI